MPQSPVLVTGINGYIGSHIGLQLLRRGYIVRGTSRSASTKDMLLQEAFKGFESQYEHYVVPDITIPGAFDRAVEGVQAIIHVASPIDMSLKTIDDFFGPATGGVISILNSAQTAGSQFKSFVLTSSIAAVMDRVNQPVDHVYDDTDWNLSSEPAARKEFNVFQAYSASKAIAERKFWEWHDQNKPNFSLSTVNPGLVFGAPVVWPSTPDKLNASLSTAWNIFSGRAKTVPEGIGSGMVIDVQDVAAMHIWCSEHPEEANGQRFIAVSGKLPPQAIADIIRAHYPDRDVVVGEPGKGYILGTFGFDVGGVAVDKMYAALGKDKIIMPDKMILETVRAFEKRWPAAVEN